MILVGRSPRAGSLLEPGSISVMNSEFLKRATLVAVALVSSAGVALDVKSRRWSELFLSDLCDWAEAYKAATGTSRIINRSARAAASSRSRRAP